MNDSQINIAIAEACGWTLVKDDPNFHEYWEHPKDGRKIGVAANPSPFPDYCNDLNAMHEAEHRLCKLEFGWRTYADALEDVVGVNGWWAIMGEADKRLVLHATARQRAEAFLRTLGKWEGVQS